MSSSEDSDSENETILNRAELMPKELKKYWKSRYRLFNKFDDGIKLTKELWFSVTPEMLAIYTAKFIKHCYPEAKTVVDLFCGGGGNSLQFLKRFDKVICIDNKQIHLDCTLNNCLVYMKDEEEVKEKLELVKCTWGENEVKLPSSIDIIFGSPPWGGPGYTTQETFDVTRLTPLPLEPLLEGLKKYSCVIVLFLPRNSDIAQISLVTTRVFGEGARVRITKAFVGGALKGLLCFWGENFANYVPSSDET